MNDPFDNLSFEEEIIARLGLIWLFEDFDLHGEESVLAQVYRRL